MSESELEAYLATGYVPTPPAEPHAEHEGSAARVVISKRTVPSPRWSLGVLIASLIGISASWHLLAAELDQLRTPTTQLACDINPLVSCGASLNVWQGNLLGIPNSFIGGMAFSALAVIAGLSLLRVPMPAIVWRAMSLACLGGMGFVAWFLAESILTFHKLCPYCLIIWAVTIPIAFTTWAWTVRLGHVPMSATTAARIWAARWWAVFVVVLSIMVIIGIGFAGQWGTLLS